MNTNYCALCEGEIPEEDIDSSVEVRSPDSDPKYSCYECVKTNFWLVEQIRKK